MRSETVFRSQETIANKFTLCQTVARAARLFNTSPTDTQEAIHKAFNGVATSSTPPVITPPVVNLLFDANLHPLQLHT